MTEWRRLRLKHLAAVPIVNGVGEPGEHEEPEWPRYVRTTDIEGPRRLRNDTFKSLPPAIANKAQLEAGDLLMVAAGATIGKSYLHSSDQPACFAGYLVRFRPRPDVDSRFVAYWTESVPYWQQIESQHIKATIENFSAARYRNLVLDVPPHSEQRRIADFLDRETARIDALISKKQRLIDLVTERYRFRTTRIVTQGITSTRLKESGLLGLGHVPEHWGVASLRRTRCEVQTGPFGSQLHAEEYVNDGIPVVNPANLIDGRIIPDGRQAVDETTATRLSRHRLATGDVVFGRRGELGRAALVEETQEGWLCGTGCLRIRFPINAFHGPYLKHYLRLPAIRDYFRVMSVGSTMENLNSELLLRMPLLFPPRKEQIEIAEAVQDLDERRKTIAERASHQIALLLERREAIVTATMKGQADAD